jgi:hypothetical protein
MASAGTALPGGRQLPGRAPRRQRSDRHSAVTHRDPRANANRRSVSAPARLADFSVRCRMGRSARASTLVAGQLHARTSAGISDDRVAGSVSGSVRADDPDRRCRGGQHVAGLVTQFPGQECGGFAAMDHAARPVIRPGAAGRRKLTFWPGRAGARGRGRGPRSGWGKCWVARFQIQAAPSPGIRAGGCGRHRGGGPLRPSRSRIRLRVQGGKRTSAGRGPGGPPHRCWSGSRRPLAHERYEPYLSRPYLTT